MDYYLSLISVASVVVSAFFGHLITQRIVLAVSKPAVRKTHLLSTPLGGAVLFALVFVLVWCVVSFLLAMPWLVSQF